MRLITLGLRCFSIMALLLSLSLAPVASWADTIGFVNYQKIMMGYDKAQGLMADAKVKEADLQKVKADYIKQIEDSRKANLKNPLATQNLEKQLLGQLEAKVRELQTWGEAQQQLLENKVQETIKLVAQRKGVSVVLDQAAVVTGGNDLTTEVITTLNRPSTP
ncbi:MAG: OmpH family outer membrane protein [Vampirovibrionales bacterium]